MAMRSLVPGLLALLAALASGAAAQQATRPPDPVLGREVAATHCRGCHLISPEDRGPVPDGVPSFPSIARREGASEAGIRAAILGPHPVMPDPPLTSQQTDDVAAYIMSLGH
jgi:mono/diheme cytochrome c family protein